MWIHKGNKNKPKVMHTVTRVAQLRVFSLTHGQLADFYTSCMLEISGLFVEQCVTAFVMQLSSG